MAAHTRSDPADLLDRVGRHWGWVLAFGIVTVLVYPAPSLLVLALVLGIWLLVFGIMEIVAAFRIRSLRA